MAVFHLGFPAPSISDLTLPGNAPLVRQCEVAGFDCLWHSNQRFHREMFTRMASTAMVTERMGIGGAISEAFAVHPIITAQILASLDELSNGRVTLALGAGGSGFQMMGITRQHSAKVLKEALLIMKPLLAGQEVTFEGDFIQAIKARLDFKPIRPTPLWIATRGDYTLKMAGEHADGVIIATYATPAGVDEALALVEQGTRRCGRSLGDLRVMSRVDTCVHVDPTQAYAGSRGMVARFLWSSYPDRNFVHRAGLEVPPGVETLISQRDYSLIPQIAAQVPDELVAAFCWAGTPRIVADRVIALSHATGITEFGFWMLLAPGQTREQAIDLMAYQVLPLIRAELG